jgi:hypothetical protein
VNGSLDSVFEKNSWYNTSSAWSILPLVDAFLQKYHPFATIIQNDYKKETHLVE